MYSPSAASCPDHSLPPVESTNTATFLEPGGSFCLAFAAWEWLVAARTPEADIRVDLLVIWPTLGLLTLWAPYRTFRRA